MRRNVGLIILFVISKTLRLQELKIVRPRPEQSEEALVGVCLGDGEPSTVALQLRTVEGARFSDSFATGNFRPLTYVRG